MEIPRFAPALTFFMRIGKVIVLAMFLVVCIPPSVFADSEYVLPYPSSMPGSKFYVFGKVVEKLRSYWYFGDFAQFSFHLAQADKYLVEAKTLFEYKQYKLGALALEESNKYFLTLENDLKNASANHKDITEKSGILTHAKAKHKEELVSIRLKVPEEFLWTDESGNGEVLKLQESIDHAIQIRQ